MVYILLALVMLFSLSACDTSQAQDESEEIQQKVQTESESVKNPDAQPEEDTVQAGLEDEDMQEQRNLMNITVHIGDTLVAVDWEDNESACALKELVKNEPLTVQMSMYGGFEQVGPLGTSLPRNDVQITTEAGDIVLYSGNQIVVFYGSNAWAYTRLGHVDLSAAEMSELLSHGDVTVTLFS